MSRTALNKKKFFDAFNEAKSIDSYETIITEDSCSDEEKLFLKLISLSDKYELSSIPLKGIETLFSNYTKFENKVCFQSTMLEEYSSWEAKIQASKASTFAGRRRIL